MQVYYIMLFPVLCLPPSCKPGTTVSLFITAELITLMLVLSQTYLTSEPSYVLQCMEMMVGKGREVVFLKFTLFLKYWMTFDSEIKWMFLLASQL